MIETSTIARINILSVARCDKTSIERRYRRAALLLVNQWKKSANVLNKTRAQYKNSISYNVMGGPNPSVELSLRGVVPNIVEQGLGPGGVGTYGAFDLRTFVLKGREYVNVPFDYNISDIKQLGYYIKNKLDPASRARRLKPHSESGQRFGRAPKLRNKTLIGAWAPKLRAKPEFVRSGDLIFAQEPHISDPLTGLIKLTEQEQHQYDASQHRVFRRLSARGKAWIHPGVRPRRLAKKLDIGRAISAAYRDLK